MDCLQQIDENYHQGNSCIPKDFKKGTDIFLQIYEAHGWAAFMKISSNSRLLTSKYPTLINCRIFKN